jgi:signal peptidase I
VTDDDEAPTAVGPTARTDVPDATAPLAVNGDRGDGGEPPTPSRPGSPEDHKRRLNRTVIEWAVLVAVAVVIAIVIKTFLFQAFYIPSASMEPTLDVGDRVLVNKLSYDLHDLHRGDIVVFRKDPNPLWKSAGSDVTDLVKRVIALPGETLTQCEAGRLCIDGKLLKETYLPRGRTTTLYKQPTTNGQPTEFMRGCAKDSPIGACKVPAGDVFVMGDNRDNSSDSRDHGPIKESSIVGRVFVRIWPLNRLGFL